MSRAAIRLLQRRWDLPEAAAPVLERFLDACADGHTSLELNRGEAELLASSAAVTRDADAGRPAPLVLSGMRLQSWRLHQAESRVANRLRGLAEADADTGDTAGPRTNDDLARLFPDPRGAQRRAAELGLRRALALVTGGPGTGKTTTAAFLLALLLHRQPQIRVALAAPTGKAAARLGEAIGQVAGQLDGALAPVRPGLEAAAARARTLHRLLQWNPDADRCRFHADNPLAHDVVVVDEASMLDLLLWDRLLAALGDGARLIVLGDYRQLASIRSGRVLADMIAAAGAGGPLGDCHVELDHNYRFESRAGIGSLADAVCRGDGDAAVEVLTGAGQREDVVYHSSTQIDDALDRLWPRIAELARARQPAQALAALARVRILCALRQGPWGVEGLTARIEDRLRREGLPVGERVAGRPVLMLADQSHVGLSNGDVGVLLDDPDGRGLAAWFPGIEGPRSVPLAALPTHGPAWAMTVHRAQGSEFESVLLVLPPEPHELVRQELLYTGVTRARSTILIAADEAAVRAACEPRLPRRTGLLEKLGAERDNGRPAPGADSSRS